MTVCWIISKLSLQFIIKQILSQSKLELGAGEMAYQLRALAALVKNQSLGSSTHVRELTTTNSSFRSSVLILLTSVGTYTHMHIPRYGYTHTHIILK